MQIYTFENFKSQNPNVIYTEYHSNNKDFIEERIIIIDKWRLEISIWSPNDEQIHIRIFYNDVEQDYYDIYNDGNFTIKICDDKFLIFDYKNSSNNFDYILLSHTNIVRSGNYVPGSGNIHPDKYNYYLIIDDHYLVAFSNGDDPFIIDCFTSKASSFNNRKDNYYTDNMEMHPYLSIDYRRPFDNPPMEYLNISIDTNNQFIKVLLLRIDYNVLYDIESTVEYQYTFEIDYNNVRLILTDCKQI
jgi:hypothetical protein